MKIYMTAREDYLKAILVLHQKIGDVRSVDLARYLGFSKPSISQAVGILTAEGYITVEGKHNLQLTDKGKEIAEKIYERHCFFEKHLISIGVDPKTAGEDACRLEHAISDESFYKLKAVIEEAEIGKKTQ